jgi:hypothetical protein
LGIPGGSISAALIDCLPDEIAIGGGYESTDDMTFAYVSYQSATTTWRLMFKNTGGGHASVYTYAVCLK